MEARSIVCLSVEFDPDEADAQACRTVLALTGALVEFGGIKGHVVVELRDVDNEDIVRLGIQNFDEARNLVKPLVANDLTGRLMIQCALEVRPPALCAAELLTSSLSAQPCPCLHSHPRAIHPLLQPRVLAA